MGLNQTRIALRFSLILVLILSCSVSAWDEPIVMSFQSVFIQCDDSDCAPEKVRQTLSFHPQILSIEFGSFMSGASFRQINPLLPGMCTPVLSSELRL
jgi:hypothetical protein